MTNGQGRPRTPMLDAWQRHRTPVGSPLWWAACWERNALEAAAQGCTPETVAQDLVEPYQQYAEALTDAGYCHAASLTDRQLEALEPVRHARSLTLKAKLAVLKLAETHQVDLHHYEGHCRRQDQRWASQLRARRVQRKASA